MILDLQPTLENEIVILRPLRENDFESLYQAAKDPLIWEQHPNNDRFKREVFTDFFKDSIESKGALLITDKASNEVIGSTRFKPINGAESAVEIGWSFLSRKYWGGVYNKSVKKLMIDYAFESIEDVIFYIGKNNIRSQKSVEKIGGKKITKLKYHHLIKYNQNELTYRINKNDWKG
jgi:RimJ/RimL family protein N-acetyltransferase